ncbi:MAG TPA: extracellular solute-binding protein, partial [Thermoplasmata archaeon]|nr:extracellular solute-binding protein [Thermoplasmata archaeon]
VQSWDQLFDTSSGGFLDMNRGPPSRVTLHADRDETLGAAAIYLGKSVNDLSPATLNEVEQTIIAAKPYLAQFADATTYYDGLLNDQFHASHAWSGDVIFVREDGSKPEIVYTVPDEGAHLWTDNFVIPKNAPNRDTAMVFINYMWEAANQAVLAMFRNYMIANRLALRGGTLDLQRNAGTPLGMVIPYVGGLPDINVIADANDVPDRAPLLQVTQARTEAENRTLDELWLRIQAA